MVRRCAALRVTRRLDLSGGVGAGSLCCVLFAAPANTCWLLDEPTNHLDADACNGSSSTSRQYLGAVLAVTQIVLPRQRSLAGFWKSDRGRLYPYEGTTLRTSNPRPPF